MFDGTGPTSSNVLRASSVESATLGPEYGPDHMVSYFAVVHVAVWGLVGLLDR